MKFEEVINSIGTITELKRIASAHVVDYSNLNEEALREALAKVKPQYLHEESVKDKLETALFLEQSSDRRVLSRIILIEIILNQDDFLLPQEETEEKVIMFEKEIVDRSNEVEIIDLAYGDKDSQFFKDLDLYNFVLFTAWENDDIKSPDEANLLNKLRRKLSITWREHRILEAKLGKFPKSNNELHSRSEITDVRRYLQSSGLLFSIRDDDKNNYDVIPIELVKIIRELLKIEIKRHSYKMLLEHKLVRKKTYLKEVLKKAGITFGKYDSSDALKNRIMQKIPPSQLIGGKSNRDGLSNEILYQWCQDLNLNVAGTKTERIQRIIEHYDSIRLREEEPDDERAIWYDYYSEFAARNSDVLRSQHIIEKDNEMENKFERATEYLFDNKLNLTPLKQIGTSHPDGLLSFRDMHIMWDNKSKESTVNLKDHIKQFDGYIKSSEKMVPMFLVIGPSFTEESEPLAIKYASENIGRNIILITADELKDLAEEWSKESNKKKDEPFPLGLLNQGGRYNRKRLPSPL